MARLLRPKLATRPIRSVYHHATSPAQRLAQVITRNKQAQAKRASALAKRAHAAAEKGR